MIDNMSGPIGRKKKKDKKINEFLFNYFILFTHLSQKYLEKTLNNAYNYLRNKTIYFNFTKFYF